MCQLCDLPFLTARHNVPTGTDLFYKAMSMCGTDFDMMAGVFPTRTHRQLKVSQNTTTGEARDSESALRSSVLWVSPLSLIPQNKYLAENKRDTARVNEVLAKR